ncbi:polysaccharide deacetylase family protein [Pseudomonas protegens]|uniref:Polysaccharide deacetylase family protein n=2 Tax=Pseudomonas protegens TaxID=380021 RepID=Q4KJZ9_PSEF5|nr:polysaccharide deacetylase family protein [Pseudomonas protegens]AAY95699.1 polysaccharide deacetylase family protein [Pseudomonas protegens Pf-5]ASE20161.1 polysaccharide deacetylase family protein [Pseudomonas protegens]QEZ50277.1 polysaccharide deacetylase family protein [Pseudomonas protegens]QEZ57629.1 polysaccharide deacetylase family protein [Pseudomonas protegens]QEZ61559.1 polysaccharide deacetylase family protein [Pseudomonas protegens]
MRIRVFPWLLALCLTTGVAQAAGPLVFATIDRSGWPNPLTSAADFDIASRAEILMFSKALLATEALDDKALKQRLGVRQLDRKSVDQLRQRFWEQLLDNYRQASQDCDGEPFCLQVRSLGELRQLAASFTGASKAAYGAWGEASGQFHQQYLNEQLRLAALFPAVSSEIQRMDPAERLGDELADRQFLLTFDDGPSLRDGPTDQLIEVLRAYDLHSLFFVLGDSFQARLSQSSAGKMRELYDGQCVGVHGWEHKSHSSWNEWQSSVIRSANLANRTLTNEYLPLFRPPYGQRRSDSAGFFKAQGVQVMLWNIDSQDWSKKVGAEAAAQRVQTLMLLWRRGIILFHDTHAKAAQAVPALLKANQHNGVQWLDCRTLR